MTTLIYLIGGMIGSAYKWIHQIGCSENKIKKAISTDLWLIFTTILVLLAIAGVTGIIILLIHLSKMGWVIGGSIISLMMFIQLAQLETEW